MIIKWNKEKDELLKATRNISFEQVVEEINAHRNTKPETNSVHQNQFITVVKINNYPCVVPFVIEENGDWFLKTVYPCRKMKGRL